MSDKPVWGSYVFYQDKCFFVSTINRAFDTYEGTVRGEETLTWEYDWEKKERGKWIGQSGGVSDHQATCRCLVNTGTIPGTDSEEFRRFR